MSEESEDKEYKPTLTGRKITQLAVDRPRRNTRKQVDYKESTVILDEAGSHTGSSELQLADRTPIRERSGESIREIRHSSSESIWGSSERSVSFDCWSPGTVETRTKALVEGVEEVKLQLSQIRMAKKEELSVADLMKMMIDVNNRDKEEARKEKEAARIREEEREERAIAREEDRRRQEIEREEKRLQDRQDREEERRREENIREDRRIERETREREQAAEREVQLLATLKAAQPAVPQTIHLDNTKLPVMTRGEDLELFLELFESALTAGGVPEAKWVPKLHASLDTETKLAIKETITRPGATYAEIKGALVGQTHLTFAAASESLMTLEQGAITKLPIRQAVQKVARLFEKISTEATSMREMCLYSAVAVTRVALSREAKQYIDVKGSCEWNSFCCSLEEWQRTNPGRPVWDYKGRFSTERPAYTNRPPFRPIGHVRKQGDCFFCGKPGHFAAECRSRLAGDKTSLPRQDTSVPAHQPQTTSDLPKPTRGSSRPLAETTCFNCHQKGHISPNCPTKRMKVKKVRVDQGKIEILKENEVFGAVGPHRMPITLDTGAEITVVPEEAVQPQQFSGKSRTLRSFNNTESEGKVCMVHVKVGEHILFKEAVTQPGASLGWSACLSFNLADPVERDALTKQITERAAMSHKETLYVPPEVREGILVSGVLVKEAQVVKGVKWKPPKTEQVPLLAAAAEAPEGEIITQVEVQEDHTEDEISNDEENSQEEVAEKDEGTRELNLEMAEVSAESLDGSAEEEGCKGIDAVSIREGMPRVEMAAESQSDPSLKPLYNLAELDREGYHLVQGLVFRTRLDQLGNRVEQLCVPKTYRQRCLQAAHTSFGHQGRNKMALLLRPYFYWPNLNKDCQTYIRQCDKCQRVDKATPRPNEMIERDVVTQPCQDLAIDIVGPFPIAVGGFKYLLTCIDNATRWPEAVPIRTTTARAIISVLTDIFVRTGFPVKITTDNGSQFSGRAFKKWLREKGIQHARSTPYHPQGNGVIERFHRTLNAIVSKTTVCKGNWAKVIPMALYFVRCTPSATTGVSPFLAVHGWEPQTPLQVLYQAWVDQELGPIDLTEWVDINTDRVEQARDIATSSKVTVSDKRKKKWDVKARNRIFVVGDQVLIRRPGLDAKLRESWEGPGVVLAVNSPVSYKVQTDKRTMKTVNVQQLKQYLQETTIKRVTSVLQQDTTEDDITNTLGNAKIQDQELTELQQAQLKETLGRFEKVLDKEPGLTSLVEFAIDTGDADPIYQHPYNTPVTLRASVDKEIDWLLERHFIRPSSSPWASPMVTVKKADGSARLCVDFRKINGLTRQTPFYMPRVEEVLEGVGRANYISKLDLSKGYYQVQLTEEAVPKTAFTSHRGVFEFTRMPFGVKNAPACFQALMQRVLADQREWATAYMDDVVVYSRTWEEHLTHIRCVLDSLKKAGLTANPTKCRWGGKSVEFLGHWVGAGSMTIPKHKTEAIIEYRKPQTKKGLRAFIGSVSFYRRYIDHLAKYTATLTPMTSKQAPQRLDWTAEGECAFRYICNFFCSVPVLCIPELDDVLSIVTDASGKGIGGVLQVKREDHWQPAAYYSRQLRGAENRYSATELEALALGETVAHFGHYLYGRPFKAYTDHRPLEQLLTSTRLNPRLARLAFRLQHWLIQIIYLPGEENTLADALSREERPPVDDQQTEEDASVPGRHLAAEDVEETPPHKEEGHRPEVTREGGTCAE